MRVCIRSGKKGFQLILPTSLFLNRFAAAIVVKMMKSKYPSLKINTKDLNKLVTAIKRYKRKHKRLEIVDIRSNNGDKVLIRL